MIVPRALASQSSLTTWPWRWR